MRGVVRILTAIVALGMLMTGPPVAQAANIPMYDDNVARTRFILDPTLSPVQLYLSSPIYIRLNGKSLSTPTIINNTLYQYAYNGSVGTLYAVSLPTINTASVVKRYGFKLPNYLTASTVNVEPPLMFRPSQGASAADSQDALATSQGWQAIAVGSHIYAWRQGTWPKSSSGVRIAHILGDNNRLAVDMSPLITPPIKVRVLNLTTLRPTTVTLPMVVAGSWDGGVRAMPLGLTANEVPISEPSYIASTDVPGDTSASITSDPVFVPSDPLVNGDPAAVFGVSTWDKPRLVVLDLVTGAHKDIGIGQIGAPVTDAGMLANNVLAYHDEYGNSYTFSLDGKLVSFLPSHSTAVEMGEDGSLTYAAFAGSSATVLQPTVGATEMALVPVPNGSASGLYRAYTGASSPSTVEGSVPKLPWCKGQFAASCRYVSAWSFADSTSVTGKHSGPGILLMSAAAGSAYVHGPVFANGGQLLSARTGAYVGVVLDADNQHDILSWTNNAPGGGGALMIWAPVPYSAVAEATPTSVPSGGTVTVSSKPIPAGVTYSRISPEPCQVGASPVTVSLSSSLGNSGYLSLTRSQAPSVANPWSTWSTSWRLPSNGTGKPVTWTGVVQSVDKFCSTASSRVQFTEEPGASVVPVSGGPLVLSPNPALWGQNVVATLSPLAPSAPTLGAGDRLLSWSWQIAPGANLSYPAKNKAAWAVALPALPVGQVTIPMTASGHTATTRFVENWWDGGCHTPVVGACVGIDNLLRQNVPPVPGVAYDWGTPIPSRSWPVTADYALNISVTYETSRQSCTTDPKTGKTSCSTVWSAPIARTYVVPQSPAQANLTTDGTSIDVVGGG